MSVADPASIQGLYGQPDAGIKAWGGAVDKMASLQDTFHTPTKQLKSELDQQIEIVQKYYEQLEAEYKAKAEEYVDKLARASSQLDDIDRQFVGFCMVVSDGLEEDGKMLEGKLAQAANGDTVDLTDEKAIMKALIDQSLDLLHDMMSRLEKVKENLEAAAATINWITNHLESDLGEKGENEGGAAALIGGGALGMGICCAGGAAITAGSAIFSAGTTAVALGPLVAGYCGTAVAGGAVAVGLGEHVAQIKKGLGLMLDRFNELEEGANKMKETASEDLEQMTTIEAVMEKEKTYVSLDNDALWRTLVLKKNADTVASMKQVISAHNAK